MDIYPAIDIRDGRVVRLYKGDYDKMTVFSDSPLDTARKFKSAGAKRLHLVDLDGAKDGNLSNFETVKNIVSELDLFVQVGGGIRDQQRIEKYLELGVQRVILGTAALKNFDFVCSMAKNYEAHIAVGVDALKGKVAINGWKEVTDTDSVEFCKRLLAGGVDTVIYTDIDRDGTESGTNMEVYDRLSRIKGLSVIASGGITYMDEIKKLRCKVAGAILGKALYTGAIDLASAIKAAEDTE